jgi:hypothetical protein
MGANVVRMRERWQPAGTALPPPAAAANPLACLHHPPDQNTASNFTLAPVDPAPQLWYSTDLGGRRASSSDGITPSQRRALASARRATATAAASAGRRFFPAPQLRNLVLVACHSVYTGLDFHDSEQRSSWFLLEYQKASHRGGGGGLGTAAGLRVRCAELRLPCAWQAEGSFPAANTQHSWLRSMHACVAVHVFCLHRLCARVCLLVCRRCLGRRPAF